MLKNKIEESPLVSIILPVYNVAKYLPVCLDSILAQSYPNWELIIIDDGSQDNSLVILQDYAKRDPRIKVHALAKNIGVSLARNYGLEHIHGKWVMFMDGDDILHKYALEKSVAIGENNHVEIVMWNIYMFHHNNESLILKYIDDEQKARTIDSYFPNWPICPGKPFNIREHHSNLFEALFVCPFHSPVNKIFLRSLLGENDLKFPTVYHEDIVFTNLAFLYAKSIIWLDQCLYFYRKRSKDAEHISLTQANSLLYSLDSLKMIYHEMQKLGVLHRAISGYVRFLYKGTVPGILDFPELTAQWYPIVHSFWLEVAQNKFSKRFLAPSHRKYLHWVLKYENFQDYLMQINKNRYLSSRIFRYFEDALWVVKNKIDIRYGYYKAAYRYSLGLLNIVFLHPNIRYYPWYKKPYLILLNPLRLFLILIKRFKF